ncbi:MAG: hypothetical protein ACKVOQ_10080 [Cyclobacteriaceae bacterium]
MIATRIKNFVFWLAFGYMMGSCSCGDDHAPKYPYNASIFYRNSKGEDLLDPSISNHFEIGTIKINGFPASLLKKDGGSAWASLGFPVGYCIDKNLTASGNFNGTIETIISIDTKINDTLKCNYQNGKLIGCIYNKTNVSNPVGEFPILVLK